MIIFLMFALLLIGLILFFIIARFLGLWFQAYVSGTPIKLFNIIGMSLRKIPPRIIVEARIISSKAGLSGIEVSDLETHYLAGGNVGNVIQAMIAATKASIPLDWKTATAIDLAGRNVLDAVKTSVNPKVIDCPSSDPTTWISAVSKNGIQLKVRARVTVRTNIQQLVGGATEETVIARVGEGIVSAVGSAESHEQVLANPRAISELVLHKGLDAQTAFEIVSIDIADIDVGENIGAKLRIEKADADKSIAQAEAEKRRAMAVAEEQENSAKVVLQQAEVPKAIAQALRDGNLGVMDYYRMQNTLADTNMREGISGKSMKNSIKPK